MMNSTNKIISQIELDDNREVIIRYPKLGDLKEMTRYINILSKEQTFITFQGNEISLKDERKHLKNMADFPKSSAIKII